MNSFALLPPAKPLDLSSQMIVQTARLIAPREWSVEDGPLPHPHPNELLIEMEGCGVCPSSLATWQGRNDVEYPQKNGNLGKEGWGRIIKRGLQVDPDIWPDRTRVAFLSEGAFTTHICIPAGSVVKLPQSLDGIPFPSGPVSCAIGILKKAYVSNE